MLLLAFLDALASTDTIETDIVRYLFSDGSGYRVGIAFNGILAIFLGIAGV
ncbi:MAG: hypothetical protein K2Y42_07815 [Hyphomicrobium sp.]|jgi:hypothetical protein|uniref:hypothetical protein n=1 Tax=Hyphomicrobium sp. TaxID=82 RepID=UPI0025B8749A|nr:hypothetical protein [Hyphomicrobium sp.]MBX9862645.1 hypothetical protein [Hyphomicrobium sp.]